MPPRSSNHGPSAQHGDHAGHAAASASPEDLDEVSITNSEVESVMNHHRWRESLRPTAITHQEFSAFNSVDAYLAVA